MWKFLRNLNSFSIMSKNMGIVVRRIAGKCGGERGEGEGRKRGEGGRERGERKRGKREKEALVKAQTVSFVHHTSTNTVPESTTHTTKAIFAVLLLIFTLIVLDELLDHLSCLLV